MTRAVLSFVGVCALTFGALLPSVCPDGDKKVPGVLEACPGKDTKPGLLELCPGGDKTPKPPAFV
ncbi:MAG: hypothetical protein JWN04_4350 [Myxococcaceae bacterium]|nr:hypothetical protein [Myxococcaceae bacterium]